MHPIPAAAQYTITRKMALLGQQFRILGETGNLIGLVQQKAFKLKEDIRVYADETKTREVLVIQARQIMDFSAAYDVWDPVAGVKVGAMRRKGWSSIIRDNWEVMDDRDVVIGQIVEDHQLLALLRRFLSNLIPQNFDLLMNDGRRVVDLKQAFNPFWYSLTVDCREDPQARLDRRMAIAAGILIAVMEGRQG